jgi:hypothetical protein
MAVAIQVDRLRHIPGAFTAMTHSISLLEDRNFDYEADEM